MTEYVLEAVVRFAVIADSEEAAINVAKEGLKEIESSLADVYIYEWDDPVIKSIGEQGPVLIMGTSGTHPENLNRAAIIQEQYLNKKSDEVTAQAIKDAGQDEMPELEWTGHPDPRDPDNFWIDDKTGERVNAKTGERTDAGFAGYHRFRNPETGEEYGSFKVYHLDEPVATADEPYDVGWYWVAEQPGCLPDGDATGPFPTAEGAYLDAMGD